MTTLNTIYALLNILGSLAFFLFGMKLLSESLQKIVGERLRGALSSITSNPYKGMLIGFGVTALLQSSSAATVLLISFVNAGLISVFQSVGMVIGANIGTTVTSWLVMFFGFTFNVRSVVLPLIALSVPLYFSSRSRHKSVAEFVMGFSILFIGLQFLREALPTIDPESPIVTYLSGHSAQEFAPLIIVALIGMLITLLLQSSTATITLTIVLLSQGFIDFEVAAALIIGENIGTTATANIAAIIGNRNAKRTAVIHFLFNLIGALLALPFFRYAVQGVEALSAILLAGSDNQSFLEAPLKVSLFHSLFNVLNALVLINFSKKLVTFSEWIIPVKKDEASLNRLQYRDSFITPVSELSIVNVSKEMLIMGHVIKGMFNMVPDLLLEKDLERFSVLTSKMIEKEGEMDRMEIQVNQFLSKLTENKLSEGGSKRVNAMMLMVNNLEGMADVCFKIARVIERKNNERAWFNQGQRNRLFEMFKLVNTAIDFMLMQLASSAANPVEEAESIEKQINDLRLQLIETHLSDLKSGAYPFNSGNFYQQIIVYCEKLGDHAMAVSMGLSQKRKKYN